MDDMNVKLPHHIAQRRRIDLVTAGHFLQGLRDHVGFEGQHGLVERRHVVNFLGAGPLRDQQQPRPALVVHDAQFTQAEPHQLFAVCLETSVKRKSGLEARHHRRLFHSLFFILFSKASVTVRCLQANH